MAETRTLRGNMSGAFSQVVNRLRLLLLAVVCWLCFVPTAHALRAPTPTESQLKEEGALPEPSACHVVCVIDADGRIGLFVGNNPISRIDPLGLAWYDYIPGIGPGIAQARGEAAIQAQLARYGYGSMQEYQLDHPGYGGTMTSGNLNAVKGVADITSGAADLYLMAATSVTPTAVGAKCAVWTATRSRTAAENALSHFGEHGAEFGAKNAVDYVTQAKNFLHSPPPGTLTKIRPNGDVLRYDPVNNIFGVMDSSGAPRTMFKPDDGINYWNKQ